MTAQPSSALFAILALPFSVASCPAWSSLSDASAMSSVDPSCFALANASDTSGIPNGLACSGITRSQSSRLGNTSCRGLSVDCVANLTTDAMSGLTANCTRERMRMDRVTVRQFTAMSDEALGELHSSSWVSVVMRLKDELVDNLTESKVALVTNNTRVLFIEFLQASGSGLYRRSFCDLAPETATHLTWLQLLLTDESSWDCLSPNVMATIPPRAFRGLTAMLGDRMPASLVAALPYPALTYADGWCAMWKVCGQGKIGALSVPNFNTMNPLFEETRWVWVEGIACGVTLEQVHNYRESVAWPCGFVKNLRPTVKNGLMCSNSTVKFKDFYLTSCRDDEYRPEEGLTKRQIALITSLGGVAVVAAALGVAVLVVLLRNRAMRQDSFETDK